MMNFLLLIWMTCNIFESCPAQGQRMGILSRPTETWSQKCILVQ